jgi:hypothetical protein
MRSFDTISFWANNSTVVVFPDPATELTMTLLLPHIAVKMFNCSSEPTGNDFVLGEVSTAGVMCGTGVRVGDEAGRDGARGRAAAAAPPAAPPPAAPPAAPDKDATDDEAAAMFLDAARRKNRSDPMP